MYFCGIVYAPASRAETQLKHAGGIRTLSNEPAPLHPPTRDTRRPWLPFRRWRTPPWWAAPAAPRRLQQACGGGLGVRSRQPLIGGGFARPSACAARAARLPMVLRAALLLPVVAFPTQDKSSPSPIPTPSPSEPHRYGGRKGSPPGGFVVHPVECFSHPVECFSHPVEMNSTRWNRIPPIIYNIEHGGYPFHPLFMGWK